jgi:hypothetical protein
MISANAVAVGVGIAAFYAIFSVKALADSITTATTGMISTGSNMGSAAGGFVRGGAGIAGRTAATAGKAGAKGAYALGKAGLGLGIMGGAAAGGLAMKGVAALRNKMKGNSKIS